MPFQKLRILTDNEANYIRGKCLVAKATAEELMQLIGHFDLLTGKYRSALETLAGCLPEKMYVFGDEGQYWTGDESRTTEEYETIDFKELLGEE